MDVYKEFKFIVGQQFRCNCPTESFNLYTSDDNDITFFDGDELEVINMDSIIIELRIKRNDNVVAWSHFDREFLQADIDLAIQRGLLSVSYSETLKCLKCGKNEDHAGMVYYPHLNTCTWGVF